MDDKTLWIDWLTETLEDSGISRNQFCKNSGISTNTFNKWKHNRNVQLITMLKALDYLGYDLIFKKRKETKHDSS